MRIIPSEIKVDYGNGQVVTLGSDASWERVREYIDRLFQWDKSYPGDPVVPQEQAATEQAITEQPAETTAPASELTAPTTDLDPNLRIIDRIIIALGKSGTSLSTNELYQKMVADGYVNTAIKPTSNVHSKGRKYPSLVALTRGVFSLLPGGRELYRQLEQNGFRRLPADALEGYAQDAPVNTVVSRVPQATAPRRSGGVEATNGDYLLQALYQMGGSASLDELIDPMVSFGWRPNSATRIKKKYNVSALAYRNREYVNRNGGRISLNDKGLEKLISRVNDGLLTMDGEFLSKSYQQNSPASDAQASNTGLFVQT